MRLLVVTMTFASVLVFASSSAGQAAASAPPIVWRGPRSCQRQAEVNARFRALVTETDQLQGLDVEARVTQAERRDWQLDFVLNYLGRVARRRVQARSCDDLVEAAAVLLALAVTEVTEGVPKGGELPEGGGLLESAAVPAPRPSSEPPPPRPLQAVRGRDQSRRAALPPIGIQLDAGFAFDAARVGSWGGGAAVGWYEDHASLALGARYWPPAEVPDRLDVPDASVHTGVLDLHLTGCLSTRGQSLRWLGCGAVSISRYGVETAGITVPAQVAAWSPGADLAGGLLFPLGARVFVAVLADARFRAPEAFVVRGIEQVAYRAPVLGASTRAAVGVRLWR